jgi:hypothetical protein
VGWLTNFIHNRHTVHINMLRGWCASTFNNAVCPEVKAAVKARVLPTQSGAKRGFLLSAVALVHKRRKVTMRGSGDVGYTAHNKNSRWFDSAQVPGLIRCISAHATGLDLEMPDPPRARMLQLTSGVQINGRPWAAESMCFYYLPTDRRIDDNLRIGQVQYFVVVHIEQSEQLFVCLDQRHIVDVCKSIIIYDITRPKSLKYLHVAHLTHLVASLPYWHAGRPDIRMGVSIAPTI